MFKLILCLLASLLLLSACSSSNTPKCILCVKNIKDNGEGSLRETLTSSQSGVIVEFDSNLSDKTIVLESTIVIDKEITLKGDEQIILSGDNKVRIFKIEEDGILRLSGISLENGFSGNEVEDENGGAILNDGELHLENVKVRNSTTLAGGGIVNYGTLHVENSTFENNTAQSGPGGAIVNGNSAYINNSFFIGNQSKGPGGAMAHLGIFNNSELVITKSTFTNNHSELSGGALMLDEGKIKVQSNLFSQNNADGSGGAIAAFPVFELKGAQGELVFENNTFIQNKTLLSGGALSIEITPYKISIFGNSIVDNQADGLGGGIILWDNQKEEAVMVRLQGNVLVSDHSSFDFLHDIYLEQTKPVSLTYNLTSQFTKPTNFDTRKNNVANTKPLQTEPSEVNIKVQHNLFHNNNAGVSGGGIEISKLYTFEGTQKGTFTRKQYFLSK